MPNDLTGRVLFPGDPGWDGARHGFGARFDYDANMPQAIVYAQTPQDVANAVQWARRKNVKVRARSGCHSYEGYSSLVKDGLIIDVSEMEAVRVNSKKDRAWVGAGIDMLELTEKLSESGVTIPLATGPSVGLGGLVQGGGFGISSRRYGLTCDNVVDIELVNADGHIIRANHKDNPDLFWAIRGGGGGNFGIVTAFEFMVHKLDYVAVFNVGWRWEDFDQVVDMWQRWAPEADWGLTSLLSLHVDRTITMEGQFTAPPQDLPQITGLLMPMLGGPPPISLQVHLLPAIVAARMIFGVDPVNPQWAIRQHGDNQLFKSAASVAIEPFPMEAIVKLRTFLETVPPLSAPPSQASMVQLLGGGGKAAEPPTDYNAAFHRKAKFVVQYDGYWTAPQDAQPTIDWVVNMRNELLPFASGGYVNYHDATLGANYMQDYYASNAKRLSEIKAKYDPDNFFSFPQSIPLAKK